MSCYSKTSLRTKRPDIRPALLLMTGALAPASALADNGTSRAVAVVDSTDRFDPEAVSVCLARGRQLIRAHASTFSVMAVALTRPVFGSRGCREMSAAQPFAAFEGWWRGQWSDIDVEHLWLTVEPGVQLVLLSNDGVVSRGINLVAGPNEICGIVMGPDGGERLHQGRFVAATEERASYLMWLTPGRNYYEAVSCEHRERRYEIVEEIVGPTGPRLGTVARYAPPQSASVFAQAVTPF